MLCQALCIISKPLVNSNWSYSSEMPNSSQNWPFFVPCDLEIWQMTLTNNRAPLLCYIKVYASFLSHQWIQTGISVRKCSIRVEIGNSFLRVTLKFDRQPCKIIGHLFYATPSFVHHFMAIGEFKLELQSRKPNSGKKKWWFFLSRDLEI